MSKLRGRWVVRVQDRKSRVAVTARISCESLEGRRLLSGGFGGGGMGGMGFGGGTGQAEMSGLRAANLPGGTGGQGSPMATATGASSFGTVGGHSSNSTSGTLFANGRAGDNTPFRPYLGWENSAPAALAGTPTSADSTSAATTQSDSSTTTSPGNAISPAIPIALPFASGNGGGVTGGNFAGIMGNTQGGFGFNVAKNRGGGDPGFMIGRNGLAAGAGNASSSSPSSDQGMNSDVQTAIDALRTELKNVVPSGVRPSYASIGTLMDDLDAIRSGSLTGTDATIKVQADEAAALTALGITSDQIVTIQADEAALVTAVDAANNASTAGDPSTATSTAYQDPLKDMTDVPLLPFLTQLRQGRPAVLSSGTSANSAAAASTGSSQSS